MAEVGFDPLAVLDALGQPAVVVDLDGTVTYWNAAAEQMFRRDAAEVVGRRLLELPLRWRDGDAAGGVLAQVRGGEPWVGELDVLRGDGRAQPMLVSVTPVRDGSGTIVATAAVCTDITELRRERTVTQVRASQQAAVARLARAALEHTGVDDLFSRAVTVLARELDAPLSKVLELEEGHEQLALRAGVGWQPGVVGTARVPVRSGSQAGHTLEQNGPVVVEDLATEPRFDAPDLLRDHGVRSGVSTVIGGVDGPFGVLGVHDHRPRRFTRDDVAFVDAVAGVLGGAVVRARIEEDLGRSHAQLEQSRLRIDFGARHSELTGLVNRREFVARMGRVRGDKLVVLLDVDAVKEINGVLGHDVGDVVLCELARRLESRTGAEGLVGHLGSDEFVVMVDDRDDGEAWTLARSLLDAVREPIASGGRRLRVTACVGLARAAGERTGTQALRDAEMAVEAAKEDGREQIAFHDRSHGENAAHRVLLATELSAAVAGHEFELHYQPAFDLFTGEPVGVEALVRWRHPRRGLVPPGEFIAVAEATGQIEELGRWCVEQAAASARALAERVPLDRTWVNVSPRQLRSRGFAADVSSILDEAGVDGRSLGVEVTESAFARSGHTVVSELRALSALGIEIAVDDFGTGYSSLSRLDRMPVDLLKIDRAFTAKVTEPSGGSTVAAIVALGRNMGARVVAEGVESEVQLRCLRQLGCGQASGFHLARPVPVEDLEAACSDGRERVIASRAPA